MIQARIDDGRFASEAAVARGLEIEPSTFNRWINGYAHPRTEQDWEQLTELGLDREFLRRLQMLDKLDAWRRDVGLSADEVANLGVQVLTAEAGGRIFRGDDQ